MIAISKSTTTRMRATPRAVFTVLIVGLSVWTLSAQTEIKLPKNKFTPQQDVQLGREGAAEVRKQYPAIDDPAIQKYLSALGDRLVLAAPPALKESVYEFSFTPLNLKEINAFALPGGPMFVNRGMFDAAATEGEVVGVMAHELAHVLLRHGTANVTKAQNPWLQLGQVAGQLGGAIVGGQGGALIAQGSQFGLGTMMLRYGRDFEKQADLLGAQIMARAGYDPRALARMFETIGKESGGGGNPQWMSSHPNPGNRSVYITKEAELLQVQAAADESQFASMKTTFNALPAARSMNEPTRANLANEVTAVGTPGQPVAAPGAQAEYRTISGGKVFQASVPAAWTPVPSNSSIKVIPENGYGPMNGQTVWTHGIEFGIAKAGTRDLFEATKAWLQAVAKSNPELKLAGEQRHIKISQRGGLATPLVNPSPLGGREIIGVYTAFLVDGTLFYYITIVHEKDAETFQDAFRKIGESIKLTDAR